MAQMRISFGAIAAFATVLVAPLVASPALAQAGMGPPPHVRHVAESHGFGATRNGMERPSFKTHNGVFLSRPLVRLRPSPLLKGPQPLYVIAGDDPRP
jgi:hypothetical protein